MELRFNLKQTQRLVMTQMLQQAIKLLPMARMELTQMVQNTIEENPLLEENPLDENEDVGENLKELGLDETSLASEGMASDSEKYTEDIESEPANPEVDFETYYQENFDRGLYYESFTEKPSIEGTLRTPPSLGDHLLWQLGATADNQKEKEIGYYIIGNLTPEGYLQGDLEEVAEECCANHNEVEEVLTMIQSFDPPGIASRNLKECLLIQLYQRNMQDCLSGTIVKEHLAFLQNNRLDLIAKKLGVQIGEVIQAVKILRELDPKPGLRYSESDTQYIIPDVYVTKVDKGEYKVTMNDEGMPKLRISPYYKSILEKEKGNKGKNSAREFMEEKFRSAVWFIKSIEQRRQTIYKTASSLVQFQEGFLDKGFAYLKPLILKDVANDIGMHESTVSRVTTNKYIHTPRGIFELKFFFHSGLGTYLGNSNMSSLHVKNLIREIVTEEDCNKPITDEEMVEILSKKNVKIARRTIAKYRKGLKIGSAGQRKRIYELK